MIEYESLEEAQAAISAMNGAELLTQTISVDWAFSNGPFKRRTMRRRLDPILIIDLTALLSCILRKGDSAICSHFMSELPC